MTKLPEGVTVYVGGSSYTGYIPTALCPPQFLPVAKPAKGDTAAKAEEIKPA